MNYSNPAGMVQTVTTQATHIIVLLGPVWDEHFLHINFCTSLSSLKSRTGLVPQEQKKDSNEKYYTAKIWHLLYKCSYFLCAVSTLAYVWPTFNEEINM